MDQKPSIPQDVQDWYVSRTRVDVEQAVLYANGRQQVKIIVYVEAARDGVTVKLTQSEKDSIRLIDYRHGDEKIPLEETDESLASYQGWSSQRNFRGYLYHPGTQTSEHSTTPTPDVGGDYLEFYLSATPEALSGRLTIGFVVTGDNKWTYRTDGWVIAPGKDPTPVNGIDTGDDKKVTAERPPDYPASDFRLERRSGTHGGDAPSAGIFNDIVTVSIVHNGQPIGVREMSCEPEGMIHWKDDDYDAQDPCYTCYAQPGETKIHRNCEVPTGNQPLPKLDHPVEGKGVILLCGRVDIRRGDHRDPPTAPIVVSLIDDYGSTQQCRLGFVHEERDVLEVS